MFSRRDAIRPVMSPSARGRRGGGGRRMLVLALSGAILLPAMAVGGVTAASASGSASLTVTKICLPSADGGKFNLRIDGATKFANAPCGGSTTVSVKGGKHNVTETAGMGTNLRNYTALIGGACHPSGRVTLTAGQSKTCTITNTRKPTLTVSKLCVPDPDPGLFDLLIDGRKKGVDHVSCAAGGNRTTGPVVVTVGQHRVSETPDGITNLADYVITYSTNCPNGAITLAAGENATCTITNTRNLPPQTQMDLPVTFDSPTVAYGLLGFGGAEDSTVVVDPVGGTNKVARVVKSATAELWAGTTLTANGTLGFANGLPFTASSTKMTVRVYSPNAGIQVRLKVEDAADPTKSAETEATTTLANTWETLTFDFANQAIGTPALNLAITYNKASIYFNFGVTGATAGAKTYYFDDVTFGG